MAQNQTHIIFWGPPETDAAILASALAREAGDQGTFEPDVTRIDAMISNRPNAHACMIYHRCEPVLAEAEQEDIDPVAARDNWKKQVQGLLTSQRSDRSRVKLFEFEHFQRFPAIGLSRLGLSLDTLPRQRTPTLADPLFLLTAQYLLRQDAEAAALADELEAATERLSNDEVPFEMPSSETVVNALFAQRTKSAETASTYAALEKTLKETQNAFSKERAEQLEQIKFLTEKCDADRFARDVMIEELDGLESDFAARKDEYEKRERALEDEIERVWGSASMRLTTPLRWIMNLLHRPKP